jgi:hypothetical protein
MCSWGVSSSCTTSDTRRVTLDTNQMISHEWGIVRNLHEYAYLFYTHFVLLFLRVFYLWQLIYIICSHHDIAEIIVNVGFKQQSTNHYNYTPAPQRGTGVYCFTSVRQSKIFFVAFFSVTVDGRNLIFGHKRHMYTILWVAFLDPSDSYFLFADLVGFYTHWTYMHIFRHIFLSNYWWQKSDIWSHASYRYPISWEAFFVPSDSYFLFAEERGIISEH